jgi:hypothetical protein
LLSILFTLRLPDKPMTPADEQPAAST